MDLLNVTVKLSMCHGSDVSVLVMLMLVLVMLMLVMLVMLVILVLPLNVTVKLSICHACAHSSLPVPPCLIFSFDLQDVVRNRVTVFAGTAPRQSN